MKRERQMYTIERQGEKDRQRIRSVIIRYRYTL